MKSSPRRIIRGADVEGTMFCSPKERPELKDPSKKHEQESLQALETFWHKKGLSEGQKQGFEEGKREGEKEGFRQGYQEGQQQGFEEGKKEGVESTQEAAREEAKEAFKQSLELVEEAADAMLQEKGRLLGEYQHEVVEFALKVCEKMLRQKLKEPEIFCKVIESLLSQAKSIAHGERIEIYLAAEDLEMLEERLENIAYDSHNITKLDFISDPSLPRTSCRIESSLGLINLDIHRELENLKEDLKGS